MARNKTLDLTQSEDPPIRDLTFDFTGDGWEYFKIWIVNILLTILTLGIYSAWAKVRTQQYFYGNTQLDNAAFRYTAQPLAILIGRLIAVGAFVVYSLAQEFMPSLALILIAAFLTVLPVVIVRAMAFKLGNSVYRNVAFGFERNYKQAYAVFLGPIVTFGVLIALAGLGAHLARGGHENLATTGIGIAVLAYLLGLPFFNYLAAAFYVNNSRYGDSDFAFGAGAGAFYKLYGTTLLVGLLAMIPAGVLLGAIGGGTAMLLIKSVSTSGNGVAQVMPIILSQVLMLMVVLPFYTLVYAYFQAKRFNLIYNHSTLAQSHGFSAGLTTGGLAWLYLSNTLLIICTLGLAIPWAKVRAARYHLANLAFIAADDLNRFASEQSEKAGALGDELGEVFDLDVGL